MFFVRQRPNLQSLLQESPNPDSRSTANMRIIAGWVVLLTLWLPIPAVSARDMAPRFWAGSAVEEITPEPGSPMSGYGDRGNKPSEGVHDKLHCRCLFLQGGNKRIALVSADMLVFTLEMRKAILDRIQDLDVDLVLLAATHTHSGPGGYKKGWAVEKFLMGSYSQTVFDNLSTRVAETIRKAQEKLQPAHVLYGKGSAPDLCRNRRTEGGPTDADVSLLRVESPGGEAIALVINFGAHPTVLSPENLLYSGDYAGMTATLLEKNLHVPVLFFSGTLADLKPFYPGTREWPDSLEEQFEDAGKIAGALSQEVLRVSAQSESERVSLFRTNERRVQLPPVDLRSRCFYYVLTPLMRMLFHNIFHEESIFQAVQINDFVLAGIPAEISSELGKEIENQVPARVTMIAGLANDTLGYALTPQDYRTGGYEACMSFFGKNTGVFMVDQSLATIEEIWQSDPSLRP